MFLQNPVNSLYGNEIETQANVKCSSSERAHMERKYKSVCYTCQNQRHVPSPIWKRCGCSCVRKIAWIEITPQASKERSRLKLQLLIMLYSNTFIKELACTV